MEETTELPMLSGKSSSPTPSSLGVLGIFREAFSVFAANIKVMAAIILLVIIPYQFLAEFMKMIFTQLAKESNSKLDQLRKYPVGSPHRAEILDELKDDSRVVLGIENFFLLLVIVAASLSLVAATSASALGYSKKKFSFVEFLLRVKDTWKKTVITWFYIFLLAIAYAFLAFVLSGVCRLVITYGQPRIVLSTTMVILAILVAVYSAAVWTLALVVSVIEEDTSGLKAIVRAEELIKGRKIQGFMLKFILFAAGSAILLLSVMGAGAMKISKGTISVSSINVSICLIVLLKFFTFVVATVFYHECKKDEVDKPEEEKVTKEGLVYCSIPSGDAV